MAKYKAPFYTSLDKNAGDHRACGSFAVCAGNVNEFQAVFRVPEVLRQPRDIFKAQPPAEFFRRFDKLHSLRIIHGNISLNHIITSAGWITAIFFSGEA
jgi:protein gp37